MQTGGPVVLKVGCAGEYGTYPCPGSADGVRIPGTVITGRRSGVSGTGGGEGPAGLPAAGGEEAVQTVLVRRLEGIESGVTAVCIEQMGPGGGGQMVREVA